MRFDDIYVTGVGAQLGLQVRTSAMVRRGALAVVDARRTRQRSVCVAAESGPDLAVAAAREAVAGHERTIGLPATIRAHLHAQMFDKPDFWSAACYVLHQLGVTGCGVTCEIGAMSNGAVLGLEIAASLLGARPDLHTALITAGDRFAGDRFARYRADHGVLYGDAGAALVVSRTPGIARLVSAATCTDPALEGLTRSTPPATVSTTSTRQTTPTTPTTSAIMGSAGPTGTARTTDATENVTADAAAGLMETGTPTTGTTTGMTATRSGVDGSANGRALDAAFGGVAGGMIDVRGRQRTWLRAHGGLAEALRRNRAGVMTATRIALADAGITLDQARWIVLPFLGYEAVRARWARPLGISDEPKDRTLTLLGLYLGHLGAADHIVGLRHLLTTGSVEPGDYVVLASSGAGMSWTTAILQITDPHRHPGKPEYTVPERVVNDGWRGAPRTRTEARVAI